MDDFHYFYTWLPRHPFFWVKNILDLSIKEKYISEDISIKLSKYKYTPQSFSDERSYLSIPFKQFDEKMLYDIINSLSLNEELAFHSLIESFGDSYHFPLIDFGNVDRGIIDTGPLLELATHWDMSFYIYNSGRSYHAYANKLIKSSDWIGFMGSLLLLNKPSGFKLIDERWVGHRLLGGYAALRWSNNSSYYKKLPTLVGVLNHYGLEWKTVGKIYHNNLG